MILLVGDIDQLGVGRGGFQVLDCEKMFSGIAKWVARVPVTRRLPEMINRAFQIACAGRAGPVVLVLPEDVQGASAKVNLGKARCAVHAHPSGQELIQLRDELAASTKPLMIVGGSGWDATACNNIRRFAEAFHLPVATTLRRRELFDNDDPRFVGSFGVNPHPALLSRLEESDLLLVVGTQLGEIETGGYWRLEPHRLKARLIHVLPDASGFSQVFQPDLSGFRHRFDRSPLPRFPSSLPKPPFGNERCLRSIRPTWRIPPRAQAIWLSISLSWSADFRAYGRRILSSRWAPEITRIGCCDTGGGDTWAHWSERCLRPWVIRSPRQSPPSSYFRSARSSPLPEMRVF